MVASKNSVDMINGSLWDKILKFSVLYMITALLQNFYSAADIIVVGRYAGENALAGVGTCTTLINLFLNLIIGLSAGVMVLLGQAIGSRDSDVISKAAHTSMSVAIVGGIIITLFCLLFPKQLLGLINVPENVMPEAYRYFMITSSGHIPSLIYNFGSAILRAKGDTKRPLYIVLVSGLLNVFLNLLFVCSLKMGAGGVALATVISHIFNAVVIMYILTNETDETRIYLKKLKIYKRPLLKIIKFGLPSGIQSAIFSAANLLVQAGVNSFGSAAIAGVAAASSVGSFYESMLNSMYQSSIVFTSQNYGAGKFDRIKRTVLWSHFYVLFTWLFIALITHFLGKVLIGFYAPGEPLVIEMGFRKLRILGFTYGIMGFMNVMSGALRGVGASLMNLMTSILGVCGIRVVWILTVFKTVGTFESLYLCYPVSWTGTLIFHVMMFMFIYKKEKKKYYLRANI